jgi:alkanesulfonate monooxygenase SsuD/methylene tetrahydromethanopterin reductase-like flavin-dependent oxidoreductase (luciferase family)
MPVEFGLVLTERHPKAPLTQWMDNLDLTLSKLQGHFKSLWMTDHLFWDENFSYEAWTALCYIAARWTRFDIGPMVMGQSYRNPALAAKMGATLQVFSRGRFHLGLGAGWKADEHRGYGYAFPPMKTRLEQLEDALEIIKRLWTQPGKVTYHGKHYHIEEAILEPKPDPLPKIILGGGGNTTTLLAARYADWWNLYDANSALYKEKAAVLHRHCKEVGRDPASIRLTWFGRVATGRTEAEAHQRATSGVIKVTPDKALIGTPTQIVELMKPYIDLGVDYFMIDVLGLPNRDLIDLLLGEIVAKVRG